MSNFAFQMQTPLTSDKIRQVDTIISFKKSCKTENHMDNILSNSLDS